MGDFFSGIKFNLHFSQFVSNFGKRVRDRKGAAWRSHASKVLWPKVAKLRSRKAEPWIARPCNLLQGNFLIILIIFLVNFIFFSCSNGAPEVVNTDCTVVFSYDENMDTRARLSVFLQAESDVRRCEKIRVHSIDSDFVWETNDIKKIASGIVHWAGNGNFVVPDGEKIPEGKYEITFINADGEQVISYSDVNYDEKLYEMDGAEAAEYMKNKGALNLAVFDENDVLLFFGEPTEDFSTSSDILDRYNNASYYNNVWVALDNSVICILPKTKI